MSSDSNIFGIGTWITIAFARYVSDVLSLLNTKIFVLSNNVIVKTTTKKLQNILWFLKKHSLSIYHQLIEIAVEDTPKRKERFRVNYILSTLYYAHKVLITLTTGELSYVPSIIKIFLSAGWLEREVWDLFGIYFYNHPNLRRILTDYGFPCHPLRKDFPLSGFFEIRYSISKKKIVTEPVEFAQEFRIFTI